MTKNTDVMDGTIVVFKLMLIALFAALFFIGLDTARMSYTQAVIDHTLKNCPQDRENYETAL